MSLDPEPPISDDFIEALSYGDVLEKFKSLHESSQLEFAGWIDKARDATARQRRIDILVIALRNAPRLHSEEVQEQTPLSGSS